AAFAEGLEAGGHGFWFGPLESPYGAHLVVVTEREDARLPELAAVRGAVRELWREEAEERGFREALRALRAEHPVDDRRSVE
ncbi:MAG: peptidyl-prolyl cis-trans isomerase, partial [Myxococcota bacterium]